MLTETKKSLDAAISVKLSALMVQIDARYKRQGLALKGTEAAISEVETAIEVIDKQLEIEGLDQARTGAPGRKR